jgi:hypothetical protein
MRKVFWGLLIAMIFTQSSAFADSMTWKIRAFDRFAVDVKLFSKNRNNVWPSSTTVWTLKDFKVHDIKITCVSGEKICYGAFVRGNSKKYWGVGSNGKAGCKSCCYTCSNGFVTPVQNLNE